ncbi:hypothetical protein [Tenacibaculum agarivorans]|uniref:hypothetical protein n=1 Tax=Tenacibaculum agarivorans TaxID=1908389 RepID=UPI00094B8D37|nr:hypothetical protein [Tenacibaculum agarivorans]
MSLPTINLLSKTECINAVNKWQANKGTYTNIKNLIIPTKTFKFTSTDYQWFNKNNDNKYFHIYAGIYKSQFTLIIVPLNSEGKEKELASYLILTLETLDNEIILIEEENIVTQKTITLSKELDITNSIKKSKTPIYNEPLITESQAASNIQEWKNECLNWFYNECTIFEGKRIFNCFTVPTSDIELTNKKYNEIRVFFAFRYSFILQRAVPFLIFIAVDNKDPNSKVSELITNMKDWSQPCPPMCGSLSDFTIFNY